MNSASPFHQILSTYLDAHNLSADRPPQSQESWTQFLSDVDEAFRSIDERGALILDKSFDRIIAHAADAFVLHDTSGRILDFNQSACDMLGYTREEFKTLYVADFEVDLEPGAFWDDMTVDQVFTVEGTHQRKDGTIYPVETRVGAFMLDGQKVCLALCRDVSERKSNEKSLKELNESLRQASEEAQRANLAKSSFLANMSHELRTPLNAVIGYSEFLIEEMDDRNETHYIGDLERIRTAGRHLLSLIDNILDLSKIEAGKVEVDLSEFGVAEMIAEIESTVRPLALKQNNRLRVEILDAAPRMYSDVTKIRQILLNLLSNACKFTRDGEIQLQVKGGDTPDQIVFEVYDTGLGMSEEQLDRVFGEFDQADSSIKRVFGGTGLGLSISKHFCELLGGSIEVGSEPGAGTVFQVQLPLSIDAPATIS